MCQHVRRLVQAGLYLLADHQFEHHRDVRLESQFDTCVGGGHFFELYPEIGLHRYPLGTEFDGVVLYLVHNGKGDFLAQTVHLDSHAVMLDLHFLNLVLRDEVTYPLEVLHVAQHAVNLLCRATG